MGVVLSEVLEFDHTTGVYASTMMLRDERVVVAFHGTSADQVETILASGAFTPSRNDYDWLGHGVYFWEHAPLRAWQWAKQKGAALLERSKNPTIWGS